MRYLEPVPGYRIACLYQQVIRSSLYGCDGSVRRTGVKVSFTDTDESDEDAEKMAGSYIWLLRRT